MNGNKIVVGAALFLAAAAGAACGSKGGEGTGTAGAAVITPAAKEFFKNTCAPCHGETGKGDGPGAATLDPKPRNYSDKEWQKKVTDEEIKKTIQFGGAAVGKSPNMPATPGLDGKPEILNGLVAIIRSFGK